MSDEPATPSTQEPPSRSRVREWLPALAAAGGALALTVAVVGIWRAATSNDESPSSATRTVTGTMVVPVGTEFSTKGAPCRTSGGYADINAGASVAITDSAGKTVALGELGAGTVSRENFPQRCAFPFTVKGVPAGLKFYGLEVSHRGRVQYSEDQLASDLAVSLGS